MNKHIHDNEAIILFFKNGKPVYDASRVQCRVCGVFTETNPYTGEERIIGKEIIDIIKSPERIKDIKKQLK
jgi:hypothetical protein